MKITEINIISKVARNISGIAIVLALFAAYMVSPLIPCAHGEHNDASNEIACEQIQ